MERELWPLLYGHIQAAAKLLTQRYVQYQPGVIVTVYFWAVLHDRHPAWACNESNWGACGDRPRHLPSASTLSRRLRRIVIGSFFRLIAERLRTSGVPALVALIDGKPLVVGGNSKDPDASKGWAAGHVAKGYKFHAIWGDQPLPDAWEILSLKDGEKATAVTLLAQTRARPKGYLLADGNYDASHVYDASARVGRQLLAPCRKAKNPGCGKHYQSPHRIAAIRIMNTPKGQKRFRRRTDIERRFAHLTGFAGGLGPLPAWVRRIRRVKLWVWSKLLINAVRILRR